MFRQLTVLKIIFALMIVGYIGHIGILHTFSLWVIFSPLLLDVLFTVANAYMISSGGWEWLVWKWEKLKIDYVIKGRAIKVKKQINSYYASKK